MLESNTNLQNFPSSDTTLKATSLRKSTSIQSMPDNNSEGKPPQTQATDNSRCDYVDVLIVFQPKNEKELLPNFRVLLRSNNDIDLSDLIKNLKIKGFPVDKTMISYYSYTFDMFTFCGTEPLPPRVYLPAREIVRTGEGKPQIMLRIRQNAQAINMIPESLMEIESNIKLEQAEPTNQNGVPVKQKRTKERRVGEIVNKVCLWRKLYNGYTDQTTGDTVKMSLEDAAQKVVISKKSLDDYLLQIRFGKKFGFNFNDHAGDRVGVLRAYVKKFKSKNHDKFKEVTENNPKFPAEFAKLIDKRGAKKGLEVPPNLRAIAPNTISSRTRRISK